MLWNDDETFVTDESDDGIKHSIKTLIAKVKLINNSFR